MRLVACAVAWGVGPAGGTPRVAATGPLLVALGSSIANVHADQPCAFFRYAPARVGCFLIEWIVEGKVGAATGAELVELEGEEEDFLGDIVVGFERVVPLFTLFLQFVQLL